MANDDYGDLQHPDPEYTEAQTPASPYTKKNAKTPAAPAPKSPAANGEVTILATYVWQPPIDEKTEVELLLNGKWHPTYADYVEITGVQMASGPGDFIALMGMIAEYKPKSIKRLNFFTHANKKII